MFFVDVNEIRDAIEQSGIDLHEVADRLGWYINGSPDIVRVRRNLGLERYQTGNRKWCLKRRINIDLAVSILDAANVDLVDVGI